MSPAMVGHDERVRTILEDVEREHGVCVLYACEAGLGAWGLAPADRVREVRFVFARPTTRYLSVDPHRGGDGLEVPAGDDRPAVSGWDLRRALAAFHASNPNLFEWLASPVVHVERGDLAGALREARPRYFAPRASLYHYLHAARRAYRRHLRAAADGRRRYPEVLVPVLASNWIEAGRGAPPGSFRALVDAGIEDPDVRRRIEARVDGCSGDEGAADRVLDDLLDRELDRFARIPDLAPRQEPGWDELDDRFRRTLADVWGDRIVAE